MTKKFELNNGITSTRLTRRQALNMLMGGLGVGAATPMLSGQSMPAEPKPRVAANSILRSAGAPPVVWDVPVPAEGNVLTANYDAGYICYQYLNTGNNTYIASIFDIRNGPDPNDVGVNLGQPITTPPISAGNGRFVTATAYYMFVLDYAFNGYGGYNTAGSYLLQANGQQPPAPISDMFVYENAIHYIGSDGLLYRIDNITSSQQYNAYVATFTPLDLHLNLQSNIPDRVEIALSGSRLFVSFSLNLTAHDLSIGPAPIWFNSSTPNLSGAYRIVCAGTTLYMYATTASNGPAGILTFDANTGTALKSQALPDVKQDSSNMVCYQGSLYFTDAVGILWAYDAVELTYQWKTTIGGDLSKSRLYVADGFAYISDASSLVYALELANQGTTPVTYTTSLADALLGEENGICYILAKGGDGYPHLVAVDMRQAIHGFSADSTLMADDYQDDGNGNPRPATPVYRTIVTLLDEGNCPRANTAVRVWSTDNCSFTDDVNTYSISTAQYAWLKTDSAGQLSIAVTADDVSCPAIFLWAGFMAQGEAIAIYPDHKTVNTLSQTSSSDLSNAKTFAGCSMLAGAATSNGSCGSAPAQDTTAMANTIRNTMGTSTAQSLTMLRESNLRKWRAKLGKTGTIRRSVSYAAANGAAPYIQYPNSNQNIVHVPETADASATNRPFVLQGAASFSMAVDQETNAVSFKSGASVSASEYKALRARAVSDARLVGGILDELKAKVKGLGHKIKSIVCTVGAEIVHVITTTAETLAPIVVSALEHAVEVVSCFFLSVISDLKNAVEWLSYVFNWDAIKQTHAQIKNKVLSSSAAIRSWVDTNSANGAAGLHQLFQGAKATIASELTAAAAKFTGSVAANQPNGGDTSTIYNYNGAGSQASASSLQSKFKANAGTGQVTSASTGGLAGPVADASGFLGDFITLTETLATALQPYAADLGTQFENLVKDFKTNISEPKKLLATGLGDLILMVNDIAQILLTAIDVILESILKVIANFVDAMIAEIQSGIQIPVLSPLFKLIFKIDLTMVDLMCWLIAVPTSIISRAVTAAPTGAAPDVFSIGGLIAAVVGAFIDAGADLKGSKASSTLAFADWVCGLIGLCCTLPAAFASSTLPGDVGIILWLIPLIMGYAGYASQRSIELKGGKSDPGNADSKVQKFLGDFGNKIGGALGLGGVIFYCIVKDQPGVAGPRNLFLASDYMIQINGISKGILAGSGSEGQTVLAALDIGLQLGAASTNFAGVILS